ncbi:hypothetical protein [Nocardioides sp. LHG3406-4]|uniref:hypothetical protein n=1 Tax=Nocardioides sp. LHG3406-4 TaxID=2804575 RepID=UPI003CEAC7D3
MSTEVIIYVLTALAGLVVVLTRLRLGREDGGAGRYRVSSPLLNVHTVAGVLAMVAWVLFLVFPDDSGPGDPVVGIVALALWWIVAVTGLLVLLRWLPTRGRHAVEASEDSWSDGPGLSVLAHVGMLVGVLVFTWGYLTAAV